MKKFIILLFLGGIIVLFSYLTGYYFGLESRAVWLIDNALHFLGGIYAFFFIRFIFNFTYKHHKTETAFLMEIMIFVGGALILGLLWEWYEFIFVFKYGAFTLEPKGISVYFDTMIDLMFDLIGALSVSFYYLVRRKWKK